MQVPPSEEYLTAIHVMLREQWNMENKTISICSYNPRDNTVSKINEYKHPSSVLQLSLEALCVEINTLKASPWKMPLAIKENVAILSSVMPRNSDGGKEIEASVYGHHQLLPYYESLWRTYLMKIPIEPWRKSWLLATPENLYTSRKLAISSLQSIQMK